MRFTFLILLITTFYSLSIFADGGKVTGDLRSSTVCGLPKSFWNNDGDGRVWASLVQLDGSLKTVEIGAAGIDFIQASYTTTTRFCVTRTMVDGGSGFNLSYSVGK